MQIRKMDVLKTEHKYLGSNLNKGSCCNTNISLPIPVLLKFDTSSWTTSYLRFKNFKGPIWHGILNVVNQILISIFDLYQPIR